MFEVEIYNIFKHGKIPNYSSLMKQNMINVEEHGARAVMLELLGPQNLLCEHFENTH